MAPLVADVKVGCMYCHHNYCYNDIIIRCHQYLYNLNFKKGYLPLQKQKKKLSSNQIVHEYVVYMKLQVMPINIRCCFSILRRDGKVGYLGFQK